MPNPLNRLTYSINKQVNLSPRPCVSKGSFRSCFLPLWRPCWELGRLFSPWVGCPKPSIYFQHHWLQHHNKHGGKDGFGCSLSPSGQGQGDCDSQKDVSPTLTRGVSTTTAPPLQQIRKEVSRQGDRPRRVCIHPTVGQAAMANPTRLCSPRAS